MRSQGLSDFADNIRKEYKIPEIGYAVLTSDSILEMNILGFKRAGDLNINLPDYAKFIQQQLLGLAGRSSLLSKEEFEFLHYGVPEPDHYSIGWTWAVNIKGQHVSAFNGSAETFYCFAYT